MPERTISSAAPCYSSARRSLLRQGEDIDGVTEEELSAAKSGLLQQWTINRTQDGALASQLASNLKLGRTMAFTEDREAKVKSATVEQVNGVIRKYFHLDQLVQMYAGDFAKARSAMQ